MGSGIGGPARYIAWKCGAHVTGIDIQEDLVEEAGKVAAKLNLSSLVTFVAGDCADDSENGPVQKILGTTASTKSFYDGFYSILVFLHIPRAPRLRAFAKISASLKPTASFLIEDYVAITPVEVELLCV